MTTLEVLIAARELLSDPKRWTKGAPARTADNIMVALDAPIATCWCAVGAIGRACGNGPNERAARRSLLSVITPSLSVSEWNDAPERTHAEVLAAFDRAIAAERAKESP